MAGKTVETPGMDIEAILAGLDKALKAVQTLAPVAAQFGVTANVATIAIAAAGIGRNVLERAENAKEALTTHDERKLNAMLEELQRANDELAKAVGGS